jgi:hypothetical protein
MNWMLSMRDEFPVVVKERLAKRVSYRCSNPACRQSTSGPTLDPFGVINVGVAAHITAAAVGGPRYDTALSIKARRSINNGIWLCQKCAKLVDSDCVRYTPPILKIWKQLAEQVALTELENHWNSLAALDNGNAQLATPSGPCVIIDDYSSELVEYEETGQEDLRERIHIVNRGQSPALSIVIPQINLAGRTARLLSPLRTLGSGEGTYAEILNLRQMLDRVYQKVLWPPGPRTLRIPLVIEYRGLDHSRWTTPHAISFRAIWGISFAVAHPNDPQEWTDLSTLEQNSTLA